MEINFVFWKTSLFSKTFLSTCDVCWFLIFAFSIQICYFPWERCSLNLKGKPLINDISYSTPKMPQLTISLLQPISNLSGIGISTFPDHRGPHQSPKTATHTPKKQLFPLAYLFLGLITPVPHLGGKSKETVRYKDVELKSSNIYCN